ncbi:MAG: hypothetical protein CME06_14420 [Gemmatimonadetes bacterium]|nr:hypothetical protein [Gemmatimonadota bacterium]
MRNTHWRLTLIAATLLFSWASTAASASPESAGVDQTGPGPVPFDAFHPDRETPVTPAYGGRAVVHLSSLPEGLNRAIENSAVSNWMLYELHDRLVLQNWETWEIEPSLCKSWDTDDQVVLSEGAAAKYQAATKIGPEGNQRSILYGKVSESGDGFDVVSVGNTTHIPKSDVAALERGTVFTFHLPDNVHWHDGHLFDADDVLFSWEVYNNPEVDCDEVRFSYQKILDAQAIDKTTVRFFYESQYFKALESCGDLCILPRHLYDLNDPDNKKHDPETHAHYGTGHEFTLAELGDYINDNPHNTAWVGLGPYRVSNWDSKFVEAERFEGYHAPEGSGYLDRIVWRHIQNDDSSFLALVNGELDFFARVRSEDYFGEGTASEAFTQNYYKGYFYTGTYGYVGWNTLRAQLKDPSVRKALCHAFDWDGYLESNYFGLGKRVTGPQNYFGVAYNHDVKPMAYDPELAEEMLAEAGWYDRDGDEIIDKDGIAFEIEFLYPSGNKASETIGLSLQEAYEKLGVKLEMRNLEWSSFLERMLERNFDAVNLAWVPPLESDPEQLWHSKWGKPELKSSNMCGVMDTKIDELIERGQKELDTEVRSGIWWELHRYLHDELQPYMFGVNTPRKFAMNKKLRGFQAFKIAPGYSIRRWYFPSGTPGTRPSIEKN